MSPIGISPVSRVFGATIDCNFLSGTSQGLRSYTCPQSPVTFYFRDEWQRKFILTYKMQRVKPPLDNPLVGCVVSIDMFNVKVQKRVFYLLMKDTDDGSYSSVRLGEGRLFVPGLYTHLTSRCYTGHTPPRAPC